MTEAWHAGTPVHPRAARGRGRPWGQGPPQQPAQTRAVAEHKRDTRHFALNHYISRYPGRIGVTSTLSTRCPSMSITS